RAVGPDDDRGVIAEAAVLRALVERGVHVDLVLARTARGERRRRPVGDVLGHRLRLADRVRRDRELGRQREFLQADELRALAGRDRDPLGQRGLVLGRILVPALLHETEAEGGAAGLLDARERGRDAAGGGDQLRGHRRESNHRAARPRLDEQYNAATWPRSSPFQRRSRFAPSSTASGRSWSPRGSLTWPPPRRPKRRSSARSRAARPASCWICASSSSSTPAGWGPSSPPPPRPTPRR